jgi:acyl-CoA thioester hydrolase
LHEKQLEIRWSDVDGYLHVGYAVYLNYLEECRDEWVEGLLGADSAWDFVVARIAVDYRRELKLEDDAVVVRCNLERIGNSSLATRESVSTGGGGELAAEAEAVLVARDRETGRPRPLRDDERAALQREIG